MTTQFSAPVEVIEDAVYVDVGAEPKPLHPAIVEKLEHLKKYDANMRALSPAMYVCDELEKACPQYQYRSAGYDGEMIMVAFQFEAMSQATNVLRWLAARGYHLKNKPWKQEDDQSMNWRAGCFLVVGRFNTTAGKCKYVQTGTKVVPVMELQCEDGSEPVLPAAPPALPQASQVEGACPF